MLEAVAGGGGKRSAQEVQALLKLGETPAEELVLSAVTELLYMEKKLGKRPSPCDAGDAGGVCNVAAMPGRAAKRRTAASASGGSRSSSMDGQTGESAVLPRSNMVEEDECQEGRGGVGDSTSGMVGRLLSLESRLRAREAQVCAFCCRCCFVGFCQGGAERGSGEGRVSVLNCRGRHVRGGATRLNSGIPANDYLLSPTVTCATWVILQQSPLVLILPFLPFLPSVPCSPSRSLLPPSLPPPLSPSLFSALCGGA